MRELSCKVLVIGGGLGAASAARSAISFCDDVLVLSKGPFGRSGATPRRATGISQELLSDGYRGNPAVLAETFLLDVLEAGCYLNNQHIVDLVTEMSYDQVNWSEWFGFTVRSEELRRKIDPSGYVGYTGGYVKLMAPGHSFARTIPFEGTPLELLGVYRSALDLWGARFVEDIMVTRLLASNGRVVGASGFDVGTGEPVRVQAKAVILAAGGADGLYREPEREGGSTGDGYALAYQAGAPLANMEFVQFNLYPAGPDGSPMPHNDDLLYFALGGTLVNSKGERFLQSAVLLTDQIRLELSPVANLVSEAHAQVQTGAGPVRSPGGEVDGTRPELRFLRTCQSLNQPGYDWRLDGFPWAFGVERLLGGVRVDYRFTTSVPGLFACGENATGAEGADCLPGWGVAATMAGGFQAGAMAARAAVAMDSMPQLPPNQLAEEDDRFRVASNGQAVASQEIAERSDELRSLTWHDLGIRRNGNGLANAAKRCLEIRRDLQGRRAARVADLQRKLELENVALTGELIATAALHRTETRGQHRREDFPNGDDRLWLKEIALTNDGNGQPRVTEQAVPLDRYKSRHIGFVQKIYAEFPR